jgi:hypothetical protein
MWIELVVGGRLPITQLTPTPAGETGAAGEEVELHGIAPDAAESRDQAFEDLAAAALDQQTALSPPGSSRRAGGFWAIKLTASPGPKGVSFCRSKSEILRARGASETMSEEMAKVLLLACCSRRDHEA